MRKQILAVLIMTAIIIPHSFIWADTKDTFSALSEKIKNLGNPKEGIYRGAQPDEEGFKVLKAMGVKTVINFRYEPELVTKEKKTVESLGINYVSIAWNGLGQPTKQDAEKFIQLVNNPANQPVFFHCRRGAERTGVMWACYRVAVDDWDPVKAHEEMKQYKFRSFWYPHLRKFLFNFSKDYGYKNDYTNNGLTIVKEWFLSNIIYSPFVHQTRPE